MIRGASRLLLVLLCACLACEDEDDFRLEDRPSELEVCFAATLDILPESVASTNTTPSTRRHYDREPLCWTWRESRDIANDRIDFTLTRVFSIGDDGTRYGCRFAGSGNSLRASVTEGECLIEQDGGHLRLSLVEPAAMQIQDLASTQLIANLSVEERRLDWILLRGTARLDMANQFSLVQGASRGEPDLDTRGPSEDPWTPCPAAPYCFSVDLTGTGQLESDSTDAVVCADWLARLQYGPLTHRVDEDFYLDWQDAGTDVYAGVRELDSCAVRALFGSFDTRNDYRVELRDGGNFQMDLRGYHQAVVDGVLRTGFCHGSWTSAVIPRVCE